jgi:hypothetical protein
MDTAGINKANPLAAAASTTHAAHLKVAVDDFAVVIAWKVEHNAAMQLCSVRVKVAFFS